MTAKSSVTAAVAVDRRGGASRLGVTPTLAPSFDGCFRAAGLHQSTGKLLNSLVYDCMAVKDWNIFRY